MHNHLGPDKDVEITSIHAELRELDDTVRANMHKRAAFLRQLNARRAKTAVLPPETLSLIFEHVLTSIVFRLHNKPIYKSRPVFLGSISHTWRQVAWSTPQLWKSLWVPISTDKAERSASLLGLYLANVHDLGITLYIGFYENTYLLDYENDPVAQVLFKAENLKKLSVLELRSPPAIWLSQFHRPLSQLTEIYLTGGDNPDTAAFLTNAPMLRKISVQWTDPPPNAPWSQITTLHLQCVSTTLALQCLVKSPSLTEFYCTEGTPESLIDSEQDSGEGRWGPLELPNPLTLHHLTNLRWSFRLNHASDLFLHQIRLPALRSLVWEQRCLPLTGPFSSGICHFFGNLSVAPLTTLHIHEMDDADIALVKHICYKNPRVEYLQLDHCNDTMLHTLLVSLVSGQDGEGPLDERQCLPQLVVLDILGCGDNIVLEESFGDLVADLLIRRASTESTTNLTIDFTSDEIDMLPTAWVKWRPETQERLQQFNRVDKQLSLLFNGEQVDWL